MAFQMNITNFKVNFSNPNGSTVGNEDTESSDLNPDDATWILTSAFIIFTMQSGFGLVESGLVSRKNEVNIMVKNAVDVIYGGFSYWLFGFAFSFGEGEGSNPFCGVGSFLTDVVVEKGDVFTVYFFQMSFATTATTIVSGAMAERTHLSAYTVYSFTNTLSYCFPAHWLWASNGFLSELGVIDIAGCAGVHLVGGVAGLVAAIMLGPRTGKYDNSVKREDPSSYTNAMLGTFMLWWGWLGFNCGSTFGISGAKWLLAARSAVVTLNGSIGGGIAGIIYSYFYRKKKLDVTIFATGILGGLVAITAICAVCRPWEGLIIGMIGGWVCTGSSDIIDSFKVDDPVGCIATHAVGGIWGMIAVALFVEEDDLEGFSSVRGLFKGGSANLLGKQLLACVVIAAWSAFTTWLQLFLIGRVFPIRFTIEQEMIGADRLEHGIDCDAPDDDFKGSGVANPNPVEDGLDSDREYIVQSVYPARLTFGVDRTRVSEIQSLPGCVNYGFEDDNLGLREGKRPKTCEVGVQVDF